MKAYLKLNGGERNNICVDDNVLIDETDGEVLVGDGTVICHGAVIKGPVIIGANCLIGNYAFIRAGTVIGNNVKVGFSTEIKNAIIESDTAIGPQCFVADSFVDKNVYLGAQVRTSNHRLDQKDIDVYFQGEVIKTGCDKLGCYIGAKARLGVQVIILPGRIIAPDTQLGPRILVEKNLPAGSYTIRQELIRKGD